MTRDRVNEQFRRLVADRLPSDLHGRVGVSERLITLRVAINQQPKFGGALWDKILSNENEQIEPMERLFFRLVVGSYLNALYERQEDEGGADAHEYYKRIPYKETDPDKSNFLNVLEESISEMHDPDQWKEAFGTLRTDFGISGTWTFPAPKIDETKFRAFQLTDISIDEVALRFAMNNPIMSNRLRQKMIDSTYVRDS